MSRAIDTLRKIKDHIEAYPGQYGGLSPSEIAIKMKRRVSREPQEYNTVTPDLLELIRENATPTQKTQLKNWLVSQGILTAEDLADIQVEIKDRVCDLLALGDVDQADVEGAQALP